MLYKTKITIDGVEILDSAGDGQYISNVTLDDNNAKSALEIGATGANRLSFTLVHPISQQLDGSTVKLYVSPEDYGTVSKMELIEEEIANETGGELIDDNDEDGVDDEEEGEAISDEELAEAETESAEAEQNAYALFEGVPETAAELVTDEAEEDEWELIGTYYIYSHINQSEQIVVTAYDGFMKMTDTFTSTKTTIPTVFADFRAQMQSNYGIAVDDVSLPAGTISWKPCTFRQAASIFAGLLGGYSSFDENGVLCFGVYSYTGSILLKEELIDYEPTSAGATRIGAVTCGTLTTGAGQGLYFENPYVTQEIVESILGTYNGVRFTGAKVSALWNANLQAGEFVRIMTEEEYAAYLRLTNELDSSGATDELLYDINSIGTIVTISSQHIAFGSDAVTTIKSAEQTETQKDNPCPEPTAEKIDEAKTTAEAAQTTAGNAQTTATEAKATATEAQSTAEAAGKTATDYIKENADGTINIENKSTTSTAKAVVNESSFDIVDDAKTLASFGADKIELGKNRKKSTIEFCQGATEITSGQVGGMEVDWAEGLVTQAKMKSNNEDGASILLSTNMASETISEGTDIGGTGENIRDQFTEKNSAKMLLYTRQGIESGGIGQQNAQHAFLNASGEKTFASVLAHSERNSNDDPLAPWDARIGEAALIANVFENSQTYPDAEAEIRVTAMNNDGTISSKIAMSQAPHIGDHDSAIGTVLDKKGGSYDLSSLSGWKNIGNTAITLGKGVWMVTTSVLFRGKTTASGSTNTSAGNRYAGVSLDGEICEESAGGVTVTAGSTYRAQGTSIVEVVNNTGTARVAVYSTSAVGIGNAFIKAVRII